MAKVAKVAKVENIEEALLATLAADIYNLGHESRILAVCHENRLEPEAFTEDRLRRLYEAILTTEARSKGGVFAFADVQQTLNDTNWTGDFGKDALTKIIDACATTAHCEHFLRRVLDAQTRRNLAALARRIVSECEYPLSDDDAQGMLWRFTGELIRFNVGRGTSESTADCIDREKGRIRSLVENGWTAADGLSTGFRGLDEIVMGLKPGLIVLAARPSVGKTALAMNIAECVATGRMIDGSAQPEGHGEPRTVLVVSLEMPKDDLTRRLLLARAGIDVRRAGKRLMSKDEREAALERLEHEAELLRRTPIELMRPESPDVSDVWAMLRRKVHEIDAKDGPKVGLVVIDYMQKMEDRSVRGQNRQFEVAAVSRKLTFMAQELKLPVLALSQLSRLNEQRGDKDEMPKLSDLRDSGAIEQDADVVILLWRAAMVQSLKGGPRKDEVKAVVAKNRNGCLDEVRLTYEASRTRFGDFEGDPAREAARADERDEPKGAGKGLPKSSGDWFAGK